MIESLTSPVAHSLTLTLLHFLWQGLLAGLLYWLLTAALNLKSAQIRYATTLVSLTAMAVCPVVTFFLLYDSGAVSESPVAQSGEGLLPVETVLTFTEGVELSSNSSPASMQNSGDFAVSSTSTVSLRAAVEASQPYVLLLWLAGVVLSGARLTAGLVNVVWLRGGRFEVSGELAARSRKIARRLHLKTTRLLGSERIRVAAVVGFFRPVVLLPGSWLTELPPDALEAVIAHELAHIRRFDVWINLFQRLIETLFFYHPMVWWMSNRLRFERELCCDQLAVKATGDRGNYVMALEKVGRLEVCGPMSLTPAISGGRKMKLLSRVQYILGTRKPQREPSWLVGILAVASLVLGAFAVEVLSGATSVVAQEREGGRSAEAEAGPRRSAEAEAGPRRSAEEEAGVRRSPEEEAGARRPAEGEHGAGRDREERDNAFNVFRGFRPESDREAALFQMILQLQKEVASLRQEVRSRGREDRDPFSSGRRDGEESPRDGDAAESWNPRRDGDAQSFRNFRLPANWQRTKEGRVFKAYDKNGDEIVSLDEWLAMTNGNISDARREISTKHFNDAEPSGDGQFTPGEFIWWRQVGSRQATERARRNRDRDGEGERRGPRDGDGDGERRGPRDGEGDGERRGPRDGEGDGERRGPRDGEGDGERRGPRDGEGDGERHGPRDGEGGGERRGPRDGEEREAKSREGSQR